MCYPDGGTIDDIMIHKLNMDKYLVVVNAANTQKDLEWMQSHRDGDVTVTDASEQYALLALQGPRAQDILQKLLISH